MEDDYVGITLGSSPQSSPVAKSGKTGRYRDCREMGF